MRQTDQAVMEIQDAMAERAGEDFLQTGANFRRILGNNFNDTEYAKRVGHHEINVVKGDEELVLAASTTFADGEIVFTCPGDRFRLILGVGLLLDGGAARLPIGPINQLRQDGVLGFNRNTGKATEQAFAAFDLGVNQAESDGASSPVHNAQGHLPLQARLVPLGIGYAEANPIDGLGPNDKFRIKFSGLNGVTVLNSYSSGITATPVALVKDAVMSGR